MHKLEYVLNVVSLWSGEKLDVLVSYTEGAQISMEDADTKKEATNSARQSLVEF